jgi:hypothetical protein
LLVAEEKWDKLEEASPPLSKRKVEVNYWRINRSLLLMLLMDDNEKNEERRKLRMNTTLTNIHRYVQEGGRCKNGRH